MRRFSYSAVTAIVLVTSVAGASALSQSQPRTSKPVAPATDAADPGASHLATALPMLDPKTRRGLALQVALDRAGFSPGEIDGSPGTNTDRAMTAFRAAKGTAELGEGYMHPVGTYMITAEDEAGPFVERIPEDMMEKGKLPSLAYTSILELLGERFHASPSLLRQLNPTAKFARGEVIVVPNVEPFFAPGLAKASAPGASGRPTEASGNATASNTTAGNTSATTPPAGGRERSAQGPVTVIVTERTKSLEVQNASGEVVFHAPVTVGSQNDPLPVGEWKVNGVSRNPVFNYNPKLFWDADPSHAKSRIPPGPNNPVGIVWIDLSKEHYGIHGTPEPSRIGYTESHGCIRLTNWDAARVADLVAPGTKVILR